MSNPYQQPSLAGYNASPPADDGSQVASNQLEWAKHITKIGNPLKTYAQGIDAAALAAFGLTFGAALLTKTSTYVVSVNDRGRFIAASGTFTITLPSAATVGDGFPLLIVNTGSGVITVDGDSSETINGATSIVLYPGDSLIINSNGTSWAGTNSINSVSGSFIPTFSGFSAGPTDPVVYWHRHGRVVTAVLDISSGTSDDTTFDITNVPAELNPARQQSIWGLVAIDNNTNVHANVTVGSISQQWNFVNGIAGSIWTSSGIKGLPGPQTFSYYLD